MRNQWIELSSDDEGSNRPPSTDSEPPVARPAAFRQVIVAIDNRDALINIYRDQIQTLKLKLRRFTKVYNGSDEQQTNKIPGLSLEGYQLPTISV